MSPKKPAVDPAVLDAPPAPLTVAESLALGERIREAFTPEPDDIKELEGQPEFLEVLDSLNPIARARLGFKFTVLDATRGQTGYLEDSDWGSSVPTPAALALRYGEGTYRVRPKCARKGKQGGGFSSEIVVVILPAPSRGGASLAPCAHAPAASSREGYGAERFTNRLFDLLEVKHERAAAASDAGIPKEMPPWVGGLLERIGTIQSKEGLEGLPEWLSTPLGKLLDRMVGDDEAPAGGTAS